MENQLFESLRKGIDYLNSKQLPSGMFKTNLWINDDFEVEVESVFVTSFVLHSLKFVNEFIKKSSQINNLFTQIKYIETMVKKAIKFLREEKEEFGLWRFYSKKYQYHRPCDIDCTCCVLAALKEWKIEMDYEIIASKLLTNRNSNKVFKTWIFDKNHDFTNHNDVDWVVNSNALFFYSLLNQRLPMIEQYLLEIVKKDFLKKQSIYYPSLSGIYCLTRTYADGCTQKLEPAINIIKDYLVKNTVKILKDDLSCALFILSLQNCYEDIETTNLLLKYLLPKQKCNGGWSKGVFFRAEHQDYPELIFKWGSKELTTAFALEAISKSFKTCLH